MHRLDHARPGSHSARASGGGVSRKRERSWSLPAPSGAYAELPAWRSASAWFDAVMDALRTPRGDELRRVARVAPDTLLRVAYADRSAADRLTGRGVSTAHETVAAQLGMSAKTVQRARHLLEALGLAVTVAEGRYLTSAERTAARRAHGSSQVRAASTRALVMPAAAAARIPGPVKNVQLPSSPLGEQVSHVPERSPKRAKTRAARGTATRRPASTEGNRPDRAPRAIAVQRIAATLVHRMPWLSRGRHVGRVCDLVERLGLVERGWTAQQLVDAIEDYTQSAGVRLASPDDQRDPLAYLAWLVRKAAPVHDLAPFEKLARQRHARLVESAAQLAADAARRAEIDAEEGSISAVIAMMHEQFPRRAAARRPFV